jgi:hypothetical protein
MTKRKTEGTTMTDTMRRIDVIRAIEHAINTMPARRERQPENLHPIARPDYLGAITLDGCTCRYRVFMHLARAFVEIHSEHPACVAAARRMAWDMDAIPRTSIESIVAFPM